VKPAPFAYAKPTSLDQALALLAHHGDAARPLAGGQSLIASLNMRLSAPELLIDLNGLPGLSDIAVTERALRIGALVRHAALGESPAVRRHAPLLARAVPFIAHPAIRNRGTIGGSLAFADPAAELPACVVALEARLEIAGAGGVRKVPARAFFTGLYQTALGPGELLTAIELPLAGAEACCGFDELPRRGGAPAPASRRTRWCSSGSAPVRSRRAPPPTCWSPTRPACPRRRPRWRAISIRPPICTAARKRNCISRACCSAA
jgi:carbon-monoxide dehydrogenase medium subunit